jgi:hypothetical protein
MGWFVKRAKRFLPTSSMRSDKSGPIGEATRSSVTTVDQADMRALGSRIKRLKKMSQPQYRLRLGEVRVFYDATEERVEILAIVLKSETAQWLAKHGKSEPKSK